jgi:hypothetical protein
MNPALRPARVLPTLERLESRDLPSLMGGFLFFLTFELDAESKKVNQDETQLTNDIQNDVLSIRQDRSQGLIPSVSTQLVNDVNTLKNDVEVLQTTALIAQPFTAFVAIEPNADPFDQFAVVFASQKINSSFTFLQNIGNNTRNMSDMQVDSIDSTVMGGNEQRMNLQDFLNLHDPELAAEIASFDSGTGSPDLFGANQFDNAFFQPGGVGDLFSSSPLTFGGSSGGLSLFSPAPFFSGPNLFGPAPIFGGPSFFSSAPFFGGPSFFTPPPLFSGPGFFAPPSDFFAPPPPFFFF